MKPHLVHGKPVGQARRLSAPVSRLCTCDECSCHSAVDPVDPTKVYKGQYISNAEFTTHRRRQLAVAAVAAQHATRTLSVDHQEIPTPGVMGAIPLPNSYTPARDSLPSQDSIHSASDVGSPPSSPTPSSPLPDIDSEKLLQEIKESIVELSTRQIVGGKPMVFQNAPSRDDFPFESHTPSDDDRLDLAPRVAHNSNIAAHEDWLCLVRDLLEQRIISSTTRIRLSAQARMRELQEEFAVLRDLKVLEWERQRLEARSRPADLPIFDSCT